MNSIVNHRNVIVSIVVIVVALLSIALFVGVLIHGSMNGADLVKHGIMVIEAHHIVVGILPPCCFE